MRIFTGPLRSFYSSLSFKKEDNEAGFTIKGMMGHARTAEWTKVN